VDLPLQLGDFHPISLFRLAGVMDKTISSNQYAFIKGKHMVHVVVALNEIIYLARMSMKPCMVFKVDFEKAYYSVNWSFLNYMKGRMC